MNEAKISIITPTLNEEKELPALLTSIKNLTLKPYEVIVGDCMSKDKTAEVAKAFGCKVAQAKPPLSPAKGRNAGEKIATQEMLLFLDADVVLPPNFLEVAMQEIEERHLDIATCFVIPSSRSLIYRIGTFFTNYYLLFISNFAPHAGGYCIFIKKKLHDEIHGFDESLALGEDHDYVKRASKLGKFGFLRKIKVQVSVRRFVEDGLLQTFGKYFLSELQTLIFGKHKLKTSGIKFGHHRKE
jgi:glycosyltransferase involved in cell wall biosynthesis